MSDESQSAVERAVAYGIDVSLLRSSLGLTPTERVRRGKAFERFAWEIREQGRLSREKKNRMPPPIWYIAVEPFGPAQGQRWQDYLAWADLPQVTELVTLDNALCPPLLDPPTREDWEYNVQADYLISFFVDLDHVLRRVGPHSTANILAVMREPSAGDCAACQDSRFQFAGFDLIEKPGLGISALSNCRGWPLAFTNSDLNSAGLLPTLGLARAAQNNLQAFYPGASHANCHVWAVWRLTPP
jgi:hypothetical protein